MDILRFVIIGGDLAGAETAQGLRDVRSTGSIVLAGAEGQLPYELSMSAQDRKEN